MSETKTEARTKLEAVLEEGGVAVTLVDLSSDGSEAYGIVHNVGQADEYKIGVLVQDGDEWFAVHGATMTASPNVASALTALTALLVRDMDYTLVSAFGSDAAGLVVDMLGL